MIHFEQISCGSDCTGPYVVIFSKGMTVGDFISEILQFHTSEWGYIGIHYPGEVFGKPYIEYSKGKLTTEPMPDEFLDKKIISVSGSGGWSRSDFILYIEGQKIPRRINVNDYI